jgi:ABC-type branched-subunit amino acid transport system ATPase component
MAWFRLGRGRGSDPSHDQGRAPRSGARRVPLLQIAGLDVYYGRAHALQAVSLELDRGVLGIVGRNGMGKTTLCNAITGLVPASGSVKLSGEEILGRSPHEITRRGIAYVPQGRRVWPSLSVEETLRLVASHRRDVDRIYAMFPRLAERKGNGGSQLSGGEQQMLAIGRALLLEPCLLVMDEPTEGLAPVIVEQVAQALRDLAAEGDVSASWSTVGSRRKCQPLNWPPTANFRSDCLGSARTIVTRLTKPAHLREPERSTRPNRRISNRGFSP